jgi:hypothetical protein
MSICSASGLSLDSKKDAAKAEGLRRNRFSSPALTAARPLSWLSWRRQPSRTTHPLREAHVTVNMIGTAQLSEVDRLGKRLHPRAERQLPILADLDVAGVVVHQHPATAKLRSIGPDWKNRYRSHGRRRGKHRATAGQTRKEWQEQELCRCGRWQPRCCACRLGTRMCYLRTRRDSPRANRRSSRCVLSRPPRAS